MTGRLRAYGYGLATTAVFLVFVLAESATQNFVTAHSPVAGAAIGIAILLILALAFRPVHQRAEDFVEAAFTKRRREARDALARFRKELTSFNDVQQLLRRTIEAVEHTMGTDDCAIYLRRAGYAPEASSFDVAAAVVEDDDPLVVRLRSSPAPADPRALRSAALGELAFAMMAGGDLVGFLTLAPKHVEYEADDRHALSALAEAAGVALVALDPSLRSVETRKRETRPNNLPRQATAFIGRHDEVAAVEELVRRDRLVTIAGAGGMGKTRLALHVAVELLLETKEGAWFVDLAPVSDGDLVASAILSALGADQSGDTPPLERLVAYLAPRSLLLLLDNCEHLIGAVAHVADTVLARCPDVTMLATSREPLSIPGETVHRVSSLDVDSAVLLFAERAKAANPGFEITPANRGVVADICARLDGMALAIELAAARTRSISLDELSHHLQLRVLAGGRGPHERHQTMYALIDWSYDLLAEPEKRLFEALSVFAGGATLEAVAAMSPDDLDEIALMDLVTSLVDKSLLVAEVGDASQRYRYLESIRSYARERLQKSGDEPAALERHAETFGAFADLAYDEFDTGPKADWLTRCELELDNVRAALTWALECGGEGDLAAEIAGGFGVAFLRLTLLREGIEWCERVLGRNPHLEPALEGRVRYVLSMLFNNQFRYADALRSTQYALDAYRAAGDIRGIVRALSQLAQQLAKNDQRDEATFIATETVEAARRLGDEGVLAATLVRCATVYESKDVAKARSLYKESAALYREVGRERDRARVIQWWADTEFVAGEPRNAARLIEDELGSVDGALRIAVAGLAAPVYWILHDRARAVPASREALILADQASDAVFESAAIAYVAMIAVDDDPDLAAQLFGYAERRSKEVGLNLVPPERKLWDDVQAELRRRLGDDRFAALHAEGAALGDQRALALASEV